MLDLWLHHLSSPLLLDQKKELLLVGLQVLAAEPNHQHLCLNRNVSLLTVCRCWHLSHNGYNTNNGNDGDWENVAATKKLAPESLNRQIFIYYKVFTFFTYILPLKVLEQQGGFEIYSFIHLLVHFCSSSLLQMGDCDSFTPVWWSLLVMSLNVVLGYF